MIYNADEIKNNWDVDAEVDGKWVAARPCRLGWRDRIRTAWLVLKGEIDGLRWTGQ